MTSGPEDDAEVARASEARVVVLEAGIAEREARIAEQDKRIAEQEAKIATLTAQVAKLTELLGRNSSNSHLPPSSDGPGGSSRGGSAGKPSRKVKRARGGQKGHRGNHRVLLPPERVDLVIDLFPPICLGCARPLSRKPDVAAGRYQQLELRDHRPHLTEWRRHEVDCAHCGASTRAEYDRAKIPASAFGPCLTVVVAMLTGAYHLSRRKTQTLLSELLGITISLGAISGMERRASKALAACHEEALRAVQYAGIKHTDATSFVRSGELTSLWVLATSLATVYQLFDNGCRETIRPLFGPCTGILISDRAAVFTFWTMGLRQICLAHLLRKFVAFSERDGPIGAIGRELLECTRLIFEYWHGYKSGVLTRAELQHWMKPLQRSVEQLLARAEKANVDGVSGSCADILAHREALWTFVWRAGVEPTNNHAELELRDFVLWRKRSYGTQSERGDRFAERIMTVVRTARKQGKAVLAFIVGCIKAHLDGKAPPPLLGGPALA